MRDRSEIDPEEKEGVEELGGGVVAETIIMIYYMRK